MTKEITYSDEEIGDVKFVTDFLPSPSELRDRNENTKVTIALSKRSDVVNLIQSPQLRYFF